MPQQMKDVLNFIEECCQSFHCYYNLGDKDMLSNKLVFSKPAVEKYIFNKVYSNMFNIYLKKYEEENQLFNKRKSLINSKNNYSQIMEYLEVSNKKYLG